MGFSFFITLYSSGLKKLSYLYNLIFHTIHMLTNLTQSFGRNIVLEDSFDHVIPSH